MRLKKLKIFGFKSFADEITLNFDVDLIGLVGPNGCGKSNIVDAIRWVIGEQSAKSMRADKMNDVIFAGSEKRKPQNYAEVTLHLSGIDDPLIPFEEMVLTRRLHRNGESEYLINKEQCRLKDIHNVFFGSGVGKNAISIFEQGKLDQIIYLSALERRALFDETAGIGRFLQRKRETKRRLDEIDVNYQRLKDMHGEVEKRRRVLKRQAEEAKSYQESRERLEVLEKQLQLYRYQKLEEGKKDLQAEIEPLQIEIVTAKKRFHTLESDEETARLLHLELEKKWKQASEHIYKSQSFLKIKNAEEKREKEKIAEFEERIKRQKKEREEILKEIIHTKKSLIAAQKLLETLLLEREKLEQENQQMAAEYNACQQKLTLLNQEEKKNQRLQLEIIAEENAIDKKLQEHIFRKEHRRVAIEKLNMAVVEKKKQVTALGSREKTARSAIEEALSALEVAKQELGHCQLEIKEGQEGIRKLTGEIAPLTKQLRDAKDHLHALLSLKNENQGFSPATQLLLQEAKDAKSPLYNLLEPISAFYVKNYSSTLVVKTKRDLDLVEDFAKKRNLSDYSLLCLEISEGFSHLRKAKIKELEEEILSLEKKEQMLNANQALLKTKTEDLEKNKSALDAMWRKKEMGLMQHNFALQQLLSDLKKCDGERLLNEKELETLSSSHIETDQTIESLMQDLKIVREKKVTFLESSREKEEALKDFQKALTIATQKKNSSEKVLQGVIEKYQGQKAEVKIHEAKEEMLSLQEQKLAKRSIEMEAELQLSYETLLSFQNEKADGSKALEEALSDAKKTEHEMGLHQSKLDALQKMLVRERKAYSDLETKNERFAATQLEIASKLKAIQDEWSMRFKETIEEVEEALAQMEPLALNVEEAEKLIGRLRYDIEKMNAINLASIEELKQEEARFCDLDKQLEDLQGTKEDLEKLIRKLETESRKAFKETFETVRANFRKNFELLFHGGSADLKFTESQDALDAGIDIIAQPPGKQMRSISLLSGGEKCMTALALLFSIFEFKPAPFCILDEVDAPLDDANVQRFTKVLKSFLGKTQFIIVTHNKKTMQIADMLFGVSMEEKGVSKLLSMQFEKKLVTAGS